MLKLTTAASLLCTHHQRARPKSGCLGMRIIHLNGAACLPGWLTKSYETLLHVGYHDRLCNLFTSVPEKKHNLAACVKAGVGDEFFPREIHSPYN